MSLLKTADPERQLGYVPDALTKNVVRQALIEYVDARAPHLLEYDNPNEEIVRNELVEYVNTRYAGHTEAFKDQQMTRIVPRIQAAIAEIQRMKGN